MSGSASSEGWVSGNSPAYTVPVAPSTVTSVPTRLRSAAPATPDDAGGVQFAAHHRGMRRGAALLGDHRAGGDHPADVVGTGRLAGQHHVLAIIGGVLGGVAVANHPPRTDAGQAGSPEATTSPMASTDGSITGVSSTSSWAGVMRASASSALIDPSRCSATAIDTAAAWRTASPRGFAASRASRPRR